MGHSTWSIMHYNINTVHIFAFNCNFHHRIDDHICYIKTIAFVSCPKQKTHRTCTVRVRTPVMNELDISWQNKAICTCYSCIYIYVEIKKCWVAASILIYVNDHCIYLEWNLRIISLSAIINVAIANLTFLVILYVDSRTIQHAWNVIFSLLPWNIDIYVRSLHAKAGQ